MRTIIEGIDRHTHLTNEKLVSIPSFPDSMKIEITSRCNYRCKYCLSWKTTRETGNINKELLYKILKEAKDIGVKEVGLFLLGESFLVKELPEYIDYAKNKIGIEYVFLTTNGSLCNPTNLTNVINAGLDSLKFSINAFTKEDYKDMHGADMFNVVIDNIKWLSQYKMKNNLIKPRTCVSSIYNKEKDKEIDLFKNMILSYVEEFYLLPLYNQAGHVGSKNYTEYKGNMGRIENSVKPIPCWTLFNSAKVSWNGFLTACCFDHDNNFAIADLNKVSLLDAWKSQKFAELRKMHLDNNGLEKSFCAKCLGLK